MATQAHDKEMTGRDAYSLGTKVDDAIRDGRVDETIWWRIRARVAGQEHEFDQGWRNARRARQVAQGWS